MDCKIVKNTDGKINDILDQSGNASSLFKEILNVPTLTLDEAIELYKNIYSEKLQAKVAFSTETNKVRFQVAGQQQNSEILDQLKKTGLSKNVFELSNEEIEAKLVELGVDANIAKQIAQSRTGYYSNALVSLANLKDKNPKNIKGWISQLTDIQKNGGIKNVNQELDWIGLEDYLNKYVKENNPKAGNIPSSVVEDYIKSNQIEIVDVSKGYSPINRDKALVIPKVVEEVLAPQDYLETEYKKEEDGTTISFRDKQRNLILPRFSVIVASTGEVVAFINNKIEYFTSEQEAIDKTLQAIPEKKHYVIYNEFGKKLEGIYNAEWIAEDTYHYNDALRSYENDGIREGNPTKYGGYQLKGAERYREVLLTMPSKVIENDKVFTVKNRADFWKDSSNFSAEEVEEGFLVSSIRGGRKLIEKGYYIKTKEDAINAYIEDNLQLLDIFVEEQGVEDYDFYDENGTYFNTITAKNIGQATTQYKEQTAKKEDEYTSSHWSEKNILAHVRLNEKTLPDGSRVLVVVELQSDWNQQGKKQGFGNKEKEELQKTIKEKESDVNNIINERAKNKLLISDEMSDTEYDSLREVNKELANKAEVIGKELYELRQKLSKINIVPANPFQKTDQWVGLVTRRVVQMAAQEGYDGVSFITGQQSADMYSLARQADELRYSKNEGGTYNVNILKDSGSINNKKNVSENELADYVGKEVAQRIVNNEGEQIENEVSLTGVNLEVGGEGMKTFYDKIVTKVAQKEAQRFDKNAKLEEVDFNTKTNVEITKKGKNFILKVSDEFVESVDGQTLKNSNFENTEKGARKYFEKYIPQEVNADKLAIGKQPFIPITDAMKEGLNQAIPLFQKEGIGLTTAGFTHAGDVYLNTSSATEETKVHEFQHLHLDWLKANRPEVYKRGLTLIEKELKLGEKSEIKDVIDFVKTSQPNLTGEALTNEILTELLGRDGLNLINEIKDKKGGILEWLKEVWAEIKNMWGISDMTDAEIMELNLGEYARKMSVDILKGDYIGNAESSGISKQMSDSQITDKSNEYLSRLNKVKEQEPTNYWTLDVPSVEVVKDAVQNDRLVEVEGGMAIVTADGNLIGLFKDNLNAKDVAKDLQEIRVKKGGYKLDNFDGKLTKIYEKNGFRVVSRLAFNEEMASGLKGYDKKLHGTPDVVFMIYDPSSQLTIEEKSFSKDQYDEAKAYRDSFSEQAKTNLSVVAIEPNLSFETPNGETFDNYSDALKNTDEGTIKLKIDDVVIGEVSSSTDINTVIGSINDLVKQNILKGERLLNPNGTISLVTEGNSLAKKLINAYISEELFLGNQVKPSVDERGDISIVEKQSFYEEVKDLDYKQIKSKHGADVANIILAARVYEENVKPFGQKRLIEDKQEITPENELQERLLNLLNTLGVKTVSLNKYKESYKQRNGALPSSNALTDIANRVIAFTDGEVTQDVLTEEVSHFILEAVNQEELAPLLENIHKTDEWAQYAEEYFNIYQDEATVRKEILGKVLKNAIQRNFEKSQQTGTANTIIGRLADIFNKFFTRISEFITPQHRTDLDEYTKKIYDNLMLGELVNDLNQEQLDGNNLLLFQTSKNIQSEADLLLSKLNKVLEQVEAQDRRVNSVSKEEILTLKEALTITDIDKEEDDIARATLEISNIANRQVNYLVKRDKRKLLSSEESAVFSLTVGYLSKVLTELESIISKKEGFPNKTTILKELGRTLESIRKLQGDVGISQEQNVQRIFDKVSEELDLDDATKKQLLDNFNNITRDTNVFYAYVGGAINAHNPALNIASALISKAYADRDIAFNVKSKEFINLAKTKGYTEEQLSGLMTKWKRGHFLFSRFDFEKEEKDMLEEKVKIFKEVFGKEVTAEQLLKDEEMLLKKEPTDTKKVYYKKVSDYRQENQVYTPLTEEETKKSNAIYAQVSLETQMKDKELSRQRSAITREAKRNNGFSEAEKFEMEELVRKRATLKNPFDNQGKLKAGLALNEEDEIIIADGFTINTLEAGSKLVYELNLLDKLKAENFKNSLEETALPKKFIDALNAIDGNKEKLEFVKLNANISFSSEFWDTFDRSVGVVAKLREKGEYTIADQIQKTTARRKHILKANRVFNNPSETNYEDLGTAELTLKELESRLEDLYKQANKVLDKEDRVGNEMSELVTNQAYRNELADRNLITIAQKIEFIKIHVTDSNKNKIESARLVVGSYKDGFRKDLPKSLRPFVSSEEDVDLDEALLAYAETKLASYFKKLQPVGFDYNNLLSDIASDPETFFNNMPKDVSVVPNYIFLGQDENSRVNPKFAKNIEEREPQLQLYDKNGNIKYGNKEFADYFGIANLESPQATKNQKEYEVLTALYKFQDDTIDKADMKDKHSRYLLPQQRPGTLTRIANIKADNKGNLKEGFKELFAYREDDAIYGQTDGKMNLGVTAVGEMTIPRHGFNRLENPDEVTNELLYSYMWMAQEAELRKSRVGILGDIESIRTILANKSYGDKHGESTETYKMFDDFVRFNIYGQSESFAFETNFGILSKKVNLAPLVKKFQWWIRLVNLGFSVLTPLTSFLQGSVNFQIEKFVGERIDKDASRLARKQLVKLLPETMSDVMKLTSSSKLNIISEFMGQDSSLERFKNSNYSRLTRGMASSAYMTHAAADVPLSAQVMLTVLHDFRVVSGRLMTFAKFSEENKSKTRKEARLAWATYEDEALFNYIEIKNGVASITDELRNKIPDIDKRMQNVRNSISVAKQEVDSQIPSTDRTQMQRHALLSFLTLHKGWLITSMTRRFKSKHLNLYTGLEEEGSYAGTFGSDSFFSDLVQSWKKEGVSFKAVKENWKNSSVTRRRSITRVASDIAVTNALVLVALLLKGAADDDKDKDYATQFAAYMSYRLANEVTSQSTGFSNQVYKFLQNPTVGMSQIDNVLSITDLASSDVIEGGTYKGLTKGESWMYKSLPALKEYWRLTNIEKTKTSYEYFNAPVIDYFTIAGALMKEGKEKEE